MTRRFALRRSRQRGLSLVEMMVALLIGMLTVLVVVQLMSRYSGQQRSSGGLSDAQMNALLGLHAMEQDLRMAGHGLAANEMQNCASLFTHYGNSTGSTAAPIANFATAAVSIADGGSGPDTVTVRFAESVRGIRPVQLTANAANGATSITVDTTYAVRNGDLLLMVNASNACALRRVTAVTSGTALALASSGALTYNPPSAVTSGTPTWPAFASGNRVYALGEFTIRRYAVTAAGLVSREMHESTDTPVAADIVDLQAQYGISASATDSTVQQWVNATAGGTWASPTLANRKRIRAVRIALVARSTEPAASNVSPATIALWPEATTGLTSAAQSYTVPDRRFRYRVLRTVIPMKNLLWAELS